MDRSRRLVIIAGLVGLVALGGADSASVLPQEARWLAPGTDIVAALTQEPAECFLPSADPATRELESIGRALFYSPNLLGGQASRAGLSCSSCHSGGRASVSFFFPGVSGAPGSADVTSSVFSEKRGDATVNPVLIPDLAAPRATLKISRDDQAVLEKFLHGLIVEEFAGPEPAPRALQGVAAYVRAIAPQACPAQPTQAITAEHVSAQVLAAVRAADTALAAKDPAVAIALLGAARAGLGRLHARFPAREDGALRADLITASNALALAAESARNDASLAQQQLAVFLARAKLWSDAAQAATPHSLFDAKTIAEAVKAHAT